MQHLGRTLECTLCGLRGKRCHLTLHFKAKHNEVIDLAGVQSNRKQPKQQQQKQPRGQQPPAELCWQPPVPTGPQQPQPPSSSLHPRSLVEAEVKIVSPGPPAQSAANGGHLSMNEAANLNDNDSTATVQGTSLKILGFLGLVKIRQIYFYLTGFDFVDLSEKLVNFKQIL